VLKRISKISPDTPMIVVSGTGVIGDAVEALHYGAWDYILKPIEDLSVLDHAVKNALEKVRLKQENLAYREHLEALVHERTGELENRNIQLEISRRQIVGILSQAAEYRDFETGNHFLRVSEFSACIARGLGWDEARVSNIRLASPVHDIGKIGIPDSILLKKGKLTKEEWAKMKEHSQYGHNILKSNKFVQAFYSMDDHIEGNKDSFCDYSEIETAATIALSHHEFWDGNGYPHGLKGEEIPIEARITAVADVFDALSSNRPYKDPWPEHRCLNHIKEQSGLQFDPRVVEVFLGNIDAIREIKEKFKD